jgi:hypothetical protein
MTEKRLEQPCEGYMTALTPGAQWLELPFLQVVRSR